MIEILLTLVIYISSYIIMFNLLSYKNYLYNRKIYKNLSKMVFVKDKGEIKCIKGYIKDDKDCKFYFWIEDKNFTLDTNLNIYMYKKGLWINPYNMYWYNKFIKFIKNQKTYSYKEFLSKKDILFKNIQREEILQKLLN